MLFEFPHPGIYDIRNNLQGGAVINKLNLRWPFYTLNYTISIFLSPDILLIKSLCISAFMWQRIWQVCQKQQTVAAD